MFRLRPLLLTLLLAALLPLAPGKASAVPVRFDRDLALDWRLPDARLLGIFVVPDARALARVRLFTVEVTLLPSGRLVARPVVALPSRPVRMDPPGTEPVILPLPGAMPLFLGALAGLVLVTRRRRPVTVLAGSGGAT